MNILKLLFLDKSETFEQVMDRITGIFANVDLNALINRQVIEMQRFLPSFMIKDIDIKNAYVKACCDFINKGILKARGETPSVDKSILFDISKFLTFEDINVADERLLTSFYLQNNFVISLLQLSFFALVYIDNDTRKRFELLYTLWRNQIEFSTAGYVPELKRVFPYYITYYKGGVFLINPVSGKVFKFVKKGALRNTTIIDLIDDSIYGEGIIFAITSGGERVPLIKYNSFSYEEICETKYASLNVKHSEQVKNNTIGKVEPYMTTQIGVFPNEFGVLSNYTLREHLFVALMVYGIEGMKFVSTGGFSSLSLDHIDNNCSWNSIGNLALLTRCQNIQKEYKHNTYCFDFFNFFSNQLEKARERQDNLDFRVNAE